MALLFLEMPSGSSPRDARVTGLMVEFFSDGTTCMQDIGSYDP